MADQAAQALMLLRRFAPGIINAMGSLETPPHGAATVQAFASILAISVWLNAKPGRRESLARDAAKTVELLISDDIVMDSLLREFFGPDFSYPT